MPAPAPAALRVALRIGAPGLRARIVAACAAAGVAIAATDEVPGRDTVVIADHSVDGAGAVIALAAAAPSWACDLRAVVPPETDAATLGAVIEVVAAGLAVMPREQAGLRPHALARDPPPMPQPPRGGWADPGGAEGEEPVLTRREREVLALLAEGASNKAIARALSVSVHTAKFHVASLTEKLGVSSRLEAVAIGIRAGLLMV